MYFANNEHEKNYKNLMDRYKLKRGQDVQYEASIYMAAYPEIFDCFNQEKLSIYTGPLAQLLFDEDEVHHRAGLTGSTRQMCELGMSCFNGYDVSLNDVFSRVISERLLEVIFQTLRIRAIK
ncbi:hypothetical protein ACDN41_24730 [Priestia aryabhattai]|uniref:hypothetical protein n=1 Tax=Priestia TaxID=2800373 RepID=UPI00287785BB|nr:hypothetical protein [Priestia megaterium]